MTKLDDAIKAAAEAYFQEPCDDLDQELADNFCAAIQAAVKALMLKREDDEDDDDGEPMQDWEWHEAGHWLDGYNSCRAEILKNAGVE